MAATIWKGYLTFGLISVPVRIYAAARTERIEFHLIHEKCGTRIKQQIYCPHCKKVVDRKELVKGHELDNGKFVVIEPGELDKVAPESSRAIEVMSFVHMDDVDPIYLDTSYYLVPEEEGEKAYYLLQKAMEDSGYAGVARLTMHEREHVVVVRPAMGGLVLHTIFYARDVRKVEGFGNKSRARLSDKELDMAKTFVKSLAGDFKLDQYEDTYRENVEKLIAAKAKGHTIEVEVTEAPKPALDLMAALKASLEQGKKSEQPETSQPHPKKTAAKSSAKSSSRSKSKSHR
jgi:DNA end-binding protein Ku